MTYIATGKSYEAYLIAARQNLDEMVKLAATFRDSEFLTQAENLLQAFDDYAGDCQCLIDLENDKCGFDADRFWRDSQYAIDRGLGEL